MAKNEFGCICDKCGKYSKYENEFYRLILPIYEFKMNNCTQRVDYCLDCYFDTLKGKECPNFNSYKEVNNND